MEQNLLHRCFDLAVEGLYLLADSFGTTYEAVNIYLFVIIQTIIDNFIDCRYFLLL